MRYLCASAFEHLLTYPYIRSIKLIATAAAIYFKFEAYAEIGAHFFGFQDRRENSVRIPFRMSYPLILPFIGSNNDAIKYH